MKKIVVFGVDEGAEKLADDLAEELMGVAEVIREFEPEPPGKARRKIRELIEVRLEKYFGKVDLIVLASYVLTEMALEYLGARHPDQKFMGLKPRVERGLVSREAGGGEQDALKAARELREYRSQLRLKRRLELAWYGVGRRTVGESLRELFERGSREKIVVLASEVVRESRGYQDERKKFLNQFRVIEPKCENWVCGDASISKSAVRTMIDMGKVRAVLIYETGFIGVEDDLREVYGGETKIFDGRARTVGEVRRALGLGGGVGRVR